MRLEIGCPKCIFKKFKTGKTSKTETEGIRGIDFGEGTVGAGSGAALELELLIESKIK